NKTRVITPTILRFPFRNRSDYGFRNSPDSLAILAATLLSSSSFAPLIADPRIGRRGKCPVRRLLHVVENNQRDRSQHDRLEAAAKNAFTVASSFPYANSFAPRRGGQAPRPIPRQSKAAENGGRRSMVNYHPSARLSRFNSWSVSLSARAFNARVRGSSPAATIFRAVALSSSLLVGSDPRKTTVSIGGSPTPD